MLDRDGGGGVAAEVDAADAEVGAGNEAGVDTGFDTGFDIDKMWRRFGSREIRGRRLGLALSDSKVGVGLRRAASRWDGVVVGCGCIVVAVEEVEEEE